MSRQAPGLANGDTPSSRHGDDLAAVMQLIHRAAQRRARTLTDVASVRLEAKADRDLYGKVVENKLPPGNITYVIEATLPETSGIVEVLQGLNCSAITHSSKTASDSLDNSIDVANCSPAHTEAFDTSDAIVVAVAPLAPSVRRDLLRRTLRALRPLALGWRRSSYTFTVSRVHAAILADSRRAVLRITLTLVVIKQMMRAFFVVTSIAAVISTFMSHRHRHEPSDKSPLTIQPMEITGGMR